MKNLLFIVAFLATGLCVMAQTDETALMLDRFVRYASVGSQAIEDQAHQDVFPITDGQKEMAEMVYKELSAIPGVEVRISSDYYVYARLKSCIKRKVPTVAFMAHLDIAAEVPGPNMGRQIFPKIHRNYDGGDILLGHNRVLSPDSVQGRDLRNYKGRTIVTSDGSTLLGGDDKAGCAILVSLFEQLAGGRYDHGDVYAIFSQNEEVGKAASRLDLSYLGEAPDILIDIDGDMLGEISTECFTAVNCTYTFHGNKSHSSNGFVSGYADALTAAAFFLGQLPQEIHPSFSQGRQGYVHCFSFESVDGCDYQLLFRIRYFDKSDSAKYAGFLNDAEHRTMEMYPRVGIELVNSFTQYDNIAFNMNPRSVEIIESAAKRTGVRMKPTYLRAGTTSALMVAKGMPSGPCIFSGQHNAHSLYEYVCVEELVELTEFCKQVVKEVMQ